MKGFKQCAQIQFLLLTITFGVMAEQCYAQAPVQGGLSGTMWDQDTLTASEELLLIDLLDSSLGTLADKDRRGRMTGGYILLGLGVGSAVGGGVTLLAGEGDDARIVGYSLIGGGALLSGLSLIPFKVKSETERLYADFKSSIGQRPETNRQRFYYWDRRFEELAENSKRRRIIGGVSSIVTGAVTAFVLVDEIPEAQLHTFLWPAIGGVTSLILKSDEERQFETYRRAREDILRQSTGAAVGVHYGFIPMLKGGMIATVKLRF